MPGALSTGSRADTHVLSFSSFCPSGNATCLLCPQLPWNCWAQHPTALHTTKSLNSSQPSISKWLSPLLTIDHLSILKLASFNLDTTTKFHPDNKCSGFSTPLSDHSFLQWLYFPLLIPNKIWPPGSTTISLCSLYFLSMNRPCRHTASPLLPLLSCGEDYRQQHKAFGTVPGST